MGLRIVSAAINAAGDLAKLRRKISASVLGRRFQEIGVSVFSGRSIFMNYEVFFLRALSQNGFLGARFIATRTILQLGYCPFPLRLPRGLTSQGRKN